MESDKALAKHLFAAMDEYPSEHELHAVKTASTPNAALDLVSELWSDRGSLSDVLTAHEGYVVRADKGDRFLRLATGGWSGNEDLIAALKANQVAWLMTWQLSARGGLFIFRYLPESDK